jgi:FHS family L-fucose permease-like MFS transporter
MMIVTTTVGSILIVLAMLLGKSSMVTMPVFTGSSFETVQVPIADMLIVLCGLCTSVMWTSIFNLATEGLGKYSAAGAGIFMMMVVGGGILPFIQGFLADKMGYMLSYIIPLIAMLYMLYYGLVGCKNVNKDIPVD